MRITNVVFTKTGEDSHSHELGTLTVTFSNHQWRQFENIERGHYDTWTATGFDPWKVPYEMSWAFHVVWTQFSHEEQDKLDDDAAEASGEEDNPDEDLIWLENVKAWWDPETGDTYQGDPPEGDEPTGLTLENLGVDAKGRIWLANIGMWWDPTGLLDDEEGDE
jgi:hypothetical protein